jgi:uncharacterized YigZ family protein
MLYCPRYERQQYTKGSTVDEYRSIARRVRVETKVRGSRFIATAMPVTTREDAEQLIGDTRKEFHDATHNCFAYRIGAPGDVSRCGDDGEPSGTAGRPILAAIDHHVLTNVVVVVTRYFGGTKLGTGGLLRAYGRAAGDVLAAAEIIVQHTLETLRASFPHTHIGTVMHTVAQFGGRIVDTEYDEEVHLTIEVRSSLAKSFTSGLINQTSGNIRLQCRV